MIPTLTIDILIIICDTEVELYFAWRMRLYIRLTRETMCFRKGDKRNLKTFDGNVMRVTLAPTMIVEEVYRRVTNLEGYES